MKSGLLCMFNVYQIVLLVYEIRGQLAFSSLPECYYSSNQDECLKTLSWIGFEINIIQILNLRDAWIHAATEWIEK